MAFGRQFGYGDWGNANKIVQLEKLDKNGKMKYIRQLWLENPVKYNEWKEWCIKLGILPDVFGTHDNLILIDESKL